MCACVFMCERERACKCVCMCERERERVCERPQSLICLYINQDVLQTLITVGLARVY